MATAKKKTVKKKSTAKKKSTRKSTSKKVTKKAASKKTASKKASESKEVKKEEVVPMDQLDRKALAARAQQLKKELLAIRFNLQAPSLKDYRGKKKEIARVLSQLG